MSSLPMIGTHNIENALAAAALVGEACGITAQQLATGLRDAQAPPADSRRCGRSAIYGAGGLCPHGRCARQRARRAETPLPWHASASCSAAAATATDQARRAWRARRRSTPARLRDERQPADGRPAADP
jgi:hypothetical protein